MSLLWLREIYFTSSKVRFPSDEGHKRHSTHDMMYDASLQLLFTGRLIKLLIILSGLSRNLDLKS